MTKIATRKVARTPGLRAAIDAKCKDCIYDPLCGGGTWREQVAQCSALDCPHDPDWRLRGHVTGDRVCLWLREWSKDPLGAHWKGSKRRSRVALSSSYRVRLPSATGKPPLGVRP